MDHVSKMAVGSMDVQGDVDEDFVREVMSRRFDLKMFGGRKWALRRNLYNFLQEYGARFWEYWRDLGVNGREEELVMVTGGVPVSSRDQHSRLFETIDGEAKIIHNLTPEVNLEDWCRRDQGYGLIELIKELKLDNDEPQRVVISNVLFEVEIRNINFVRDKVRAGMCNPHPSTGNAISISPGGVYPADRTYLNDIKESRIYLQGVERIVPRELYELADHRAMMILHVIASLAEIFLEEVIGQTNTHNVLAWPLFADPDRNMSDELQVVLESQHCSEDNVKAMGVSFGHTSEKVRTVDAYNGWMTRFLPRTTSRPSRVHKCLLEMLS